MTAKKPLVLGADGRTQQIQSGDWLDTYYIPGRYFNPPPAVSDFAWINQGSETATQIQAYTPILMTQTYGSLNWRLLKLSAPSTPWKVVAKIAGYASIGSSSTAGIYLIESSSGKLIGYETLTQSGNFYHRVQAINSPTSDNSTLFASTASMPTAAQHACWYQIRNNGTTLYFDVSMDGWVFRNQKSYAIASFLNPDEIGWGGVNVATSNETVNTVSLLSWKIIGNADIN